MTHSRSRTVFWKTEWKYLLGIVAGFLAYFYLLVGNVRFDNVDNEHKNATMEPIRD